MTPLQNRPAFRTPPPLEEFRPEAYAKLPIKGFYNVNRKKLYSQEDDTGIVLPGDM